MAPGQQSQSQTNNAAPKPAGEPSAALDPIDEIMSEIETLQKGAPEPNELKRPPVLPRLQPQNVASISTLGDTESDDLAKELGVEFSGSESKQESPPQDMTMDAQVDGLGDLADELAVVAAGLKEAPAASAPAPAAPIEIPSLVDGPVSPDALDAALALADAEAKGLSQMPEPEPLPDPVAPAEAPTAEVTPAPEINSIEDFRAIASDSSDSEVSMEDTLGSMSDAENESPNNGTSLLSQPSPSEQPSVASVIPLRAPAGQSPSASGAPSTLSMTLRGNMTLSLKYDFEGHEVLIGFSEEALCIELLDGTEFKVPLKKKNKRNTA